MIDSLRRFLSGVCRLSPEFMREIKVGERVRLKPGEISNDYLLSTAYRLLWKRKEMYSIEIRKGDEINCFASAGNTEALEYLLRRLMAVYTFPELEPACIQLPEKECYVSAGYVKLSGTPYMLHDPEQNILTHALAAADNVFVQFLFKPEKIVLERLGYESPVFKLRVSVASFSESWKEAVNSCKRVLESFTVLSSAYSSLVPVIPRVPNSCVLLRSMLERRFLPGDNFRVTAEELAMITKIPGDIVDNRHSREKKTEDTDK
ncbi:hypothetical protein Ferp_0435 [Ferroglobus placidus DSM 10642]|uniref:Uncharacterized protein n=1 Tax=Ferroglobus placidus (strain DSM 10642 / AEDII12DO) TaxID=589924 RepID=D3S2X7_FERPA|nr:hypothetical protein [Ferroglobus placidus]ADC64610.1 hypothetical protein Ferp_0435 [Ferroglobus placidus DSM 10642]